jgi:hypothetical protein
MQNKKCNQPRTGGASPKGKGYAQGKALNLKLCDPADVSFTTWPAISRKKPGRRFAYRPRSAAILSVEFAPSMVSCASLLMA